MGHWRNLLGREGLREGGKNGVRWGVREMSRDREREREKTIPSIMAFILEDRNCSGY